MEPRRQDSGGVQRSEGRRIGGVCGGEGRQGRGREKAAEMAEPGREVRHGGWRQSMMGMGFAGDKTEAQVDREFAFARMHTAPPAVAWDKGEDKKPKPFFPLRLSLPRRRSSPR